VEKWTRLLIVLGAGLLLFAVAALFFWIGTHFQRTLTLFSLGALVAYALDPLVEGLQRLRPRGRPLARRSRVTLVVIGFVLVLGLGVWGLGEQVAVQAGNVQRDFPEYQRAALERARDFDTTLRDRGIGFSLAHTLQHPPEYVQRFLSSMGQHLLPFVGHLLTDLGESTLVLIIAIYFLIYGPELRDAISKAPPEAHRERVILWQQDVDRILGGFVRGQLLIALTLGVLAALGSLAIGIRPWLLIGLFVALTALIPVFGPIIGAIPAVAAALTSPTHFGNPIVAAIAVVVMFTIINELGSKVLYPRFVGRALGMHNFVVLFVLLAGLEFAGVLGVLFAAPLTALAIASAIHLYRFWEDLPDTLVAEPIMGPRAGAAPES
jgi:predicted PurR-regulated permease PerM